MAPMMGAVVYTASSFDHNLEALRPHYAQLDAAVEELKELLRLDFLYPEFAVDEDAAPDVFATRLDYPPLGTAGRGRFLVIYHGSDRTPSPHRPFRTTTLLTITEA